MGSNICIYIQRFFFFVYLQSTGRQFSAWVYLLSKFFFIKAKNSDECVGVMLLLLIFLFGISQIVVEVILCLHFPIGMILLSLPLTDANAWRI